MSKVDWSLAPEGATHYNAANKLFYKFCCDRGFVFHSNGDEWCEASCKHEYGSLIEARPAQPKPWSGPEDGLPPVGVTCERRFPSVTASSWQGGIILAHGSKKIFFRDNCGDEWAHSFDDVEFRAFRTPAQIAADKRETAIRELMDIAQVDCRVTAARLVNAGFKLHSKSIEDPQDGIADLSGIIAHANFRNSPNSGDGDLAKQLYGAGFRRERTPDNPFR